MLDRHRRVTGRPGNDTRIILRSHRAGALHQVAVDREVDRLSREEAAQLRWEATAQAVCFDKELLQTRQFRQRGRNGAAQSIVVQPQVGQT